MCFEGSFRNSAFANSNKVNGNGYIYGILEIDNIYLPPLVFDHMCVHIMSVVLDFG